MKTNIRRGLKLGLVTTGLLVGCDTGGGGGDSGASDSTGGMSTDSAGTGTGGPPPMGCEAGVWLPPIDLSSVGPTASKMSEPDLGPPTTGALGVHAIHLPTREIMLFRGASDHRVWPIGGAAEDVRWVPPPYKVEQKAKNDPTETVTGYPDLFCAGHAFDEDGRVFMAGGNINGKPSGGGLWSAFWFDPTNSPEETTPYGWSLVEETMAFDRWYPTITQLLDGRMLVSGGHGDGPNTLEIFEPDTGSWSSPFEFVIPFNDAEPWLHLPSYGFFWTLPLGGVFYGGGDDALDTKYYNGRALDPDTLTWTAVSADSSISGGSAVMYRPGEIMKSGGPDPTDRAVFRGTETIDLSTYEFNAGSLPDFETKQDMTFGRRYHNLVVLPTGDVLAVGGNSRRNSIGSRDTQNNPCFGDIACTDANADDVCPAIPNRCAEVEGTDVCVFESGGACMDDTECPSGQSCVGSDCRILCNHEDASTDNDCPAECDESNLCEAGNSICYAVREAELWEPDTGAWTVLSAQQHERMYHSTALLLPDGTVMSAGSGWRDSTVNNVMEIEIFRPPYIACDQPRPVIDGISSQNLAYGAPYQVEIGGVAPEAIDRVTLVRLGSTTHGFDMSQRFYEATITGTVGDSIEFTAPPDSGVAPPGWWMLFVLDQDVPSEAVYVKVGS